MPRMSVIRRPYGRHPVVAGDMIMKVILHIGAHRTGTTTFQDYLRRNADPLKGQGLVSWGPERTRKGLFAGIQPGPGVGRNAARHARGRIGLRLEQAARSGAKTVLISDENMMGSVRRNLRNRSLYADVGERLSRLICAFDGNVDAVVMTVRGLDHYWASAVAYGVARGHGMPDPADLTRIAACRRTWLDVVSDVACAASGAQIRVLPFERFGGRPDAMVRALTGADAMPDAAPKWLNRAPNCRDLRAILDERGSDAAVVPHGTDRYQPFDRPAIAALREAYADDMHWLIAGANGLATLTEDPDRARAGQTPPFGPSPRGHGHDQRQRRMAQPG